MIIEYLLSVGKCCQFLKKKYNKVTSCLCLGISEEAMLSQCDEYFVSKMSLYYLSLQLMLKLEQILWFCDQYLLNRNKRKGAQWM